MGCLAELLKRKSCIVKDGGFATQLESHGALLNDPLWSALCLITNPDIISKVHLEYLEAGADVIVTSSYQATLQGFEARGISLREGEALLRKSVALACEAREQFCAPEHRPLVAASIGSYGAYLADGSEYSGDYGPDVSLEKLKDFHRRRLQVLASSEADLLAIETIPSKLEAQAFTELLEEENVQIPAWISYSSQDGKAVAAGDSLSDCFTLLDKCDKIVAAGINCCPPHLVQELVVQAKKFTSKPIVVYPNSGELYDPRTKTWRHSECGLGSRRFDTYVSDWRRAGASVIGGCCRTTPETVRQVRHHLCQSLN